MPELFVAVNVTIVVPAAEAFPEIIWPSKLNPAGNADEVTVGGGAPVVVMKNVNGTPAVPDAIEALVKTGGTQLVPPERSNDCGNVIDVLAPFKRWGRPGAPGVLILTYSASREMKSPADVSIMPPTVPEMESFKSICPVTV